MKPHCISRTLLSFALIGAAAAQDAPRPPAWRLADASSPYLREHATDPVEWYPWGDEAFRRAKELDRPVFLTIGYSACHWCHRMQHDTFADADVDKRLADGFVCIVVDREERPDIDAHYQNALALMTQGQGGGWPASLFLMPDGHPFYGGTYYAPKEGPLGVGFTDVLDRLHELWTTDRKTVEDAAGELHQALSVDPVGDAHADAAPDLPTLLDGSATALTGQLDSSWGGLNGTPKFPPTLVLRFLLRELQRTGLTVGDQLAVSLDAMQCGGLYDHLGGGFFRYCLDDHWETPHFEKMLAENAELAMLYAEATVALGQPRWRPAALDTLAWARRELRLADGLYAGSLDADSQPFDDAPDDAAHPGDPVPRAGAPPAEGRFYLWTPRQLARVLGDHDGPAFAQIFHVTDEGGFTELEGPTGLSLPHPLRTLGSMAAKPEADIKAGPEFERWLTMSLGKLAAARDRRPRPARDDKAVALGNGRLLTAFARAATLLDDAASRTDVAALAGALRARLIARDEALPRVVHQEYMGQASGRGDLSDTAAVATGLLDAHEATGDPALLLDALALARGLLQRFGDVDGGFFDTEGKDPLLPGHTRDPWDGPVPAGSSLATELLLRLAPLDDAGTLQLAALRAIARLAPSVSKGPDGFPALLLAADAAQGPLAEVVLDGSGDALAALQKTLATRALPAALRLPDARGLLAAIDSDRDLALAAGRDPLFEKAPSLLADRRAPDGEARAWVCVQKSCLLPASTPAELAARLDEVVHRAGFAASSAATPADKSPPPADAPKSPH